MKKEVIKKNYKSKIREITKHNKLYYDKSTPIISDSQYDILKKEIIDLELKYPYLKSKNSPNQNVGFEPSKSFEKYKHKIPMLSLSNAFNRDDLIVFTDSNKLKSYLNSIKYDDHNILLMSSGIFNGMNIL